MRVEPMFPIEKWDSAEKYEEAGIVGYEPMTAKELDTEDKQDEALNDTSNYLEEKFDGTRALVYLMGDFNRVFSRRVSKKTGFYVENTDSVPQIRDIKTYLDGTILDGEMFIPNQGFQASSAVMNCKYDKAIDRQKELGFQVFHASDILFYKGLDLRNEPLRIRKMYLEIVVAKINSEYIQSVKYFSCGKDIPIILEKELTDRLGIENIDYFYDSLDRDNYPNLSEYLFNGGDFTPRTYYELIVATGGEGVIVKPKEGKYLHKRGWEYSKIKSFLTREMILIDFAEPTKEYSGKAPKEWEYYEDGVPVTRHYYFNQVGNMKLGVFITVEEFNAIPKNKRGATHMPSHVCTDLKDYDISHIIMEVCECSGYDDEQREYYTDHKEELIGSVVEVKANGIMKDSGRMRHPRFLRFRDDKAPEQCIWVDHVGGN